jgi:hypothetical protein
MIWVLGLAWIVVQALDSRLDVLRSVVASPFDADATYDFVFISAALGLAVGLGLLPHRLAGARAAPGVEGVIAQACVLGASPLVFLAASWLGRLTAATASEELSAPLAQVAPAIAEAFLALAWALVLARASLSSTARVIAFLCGSVLFLVLYPEPATGQLAPAPVPSLRLAMPILGCMLAIGLLEPTRARER